MHGTRFMRRTDGERGAALMVAVMAGFVVIGVGVAMLQVSAATQREHREMLQRAQRRLLAQTGVALSLADMSAGGTGNLGSRDAPIEWGAGTYRVEVADNADGTMSLTSMGRVGRTTRGVRAVARETTQNVFFHAMYAGNSSLSQSYVLELGGIGTAADEIEGDIYSGGSIAISGDAAVDGHLRATGTISGAPGDEGVSQPPPDLVSMNYEVNHDVNVAAAFSAHGVRRTRSGLGGTAYEVPESNPAHIFRLNPSDRRAEYQSTAKNDYFLEDPYETVNASNSTDPARSTPLTISGVSGEPGVNGSNKVYFIDGNLWVHNLNLYSFVLQHSDPAGVQLTLVVKGNVYFSDNILLKNLEKDGVAIIAVKDSAVADSGNIYFGDPVFGTLEKMQAFMYAENDFHDNLLAQSGSTRVEVDGTMSAGNHVAIDRNGRTPRAKLVLDLDARIRDGTLTLPGLPGNGNANRRRTFQVLAEFEVASDES